MAGGTEGRQGGGCKHAVTFILVIATTVLLMVSDTTNGRSCVVDDGPCYLLCVALFLSVGTLYKHISVFVCQCISLIPSLAFYVIICIWFHFVCFLKFMHRIFFSSLLYLSTTIFPFFLKCYAIMQCLWWPLRLSFRMSAIEKQNCWTQGDKN